MKTPLYDTHLRLGAKFTDFHGWKMPLSYGKGIISEVKAVRQSSGVFDISHMGRFFIRGKDAFGVLQRLTTNDVSKLYPGRVQYNLITNERGGVKDDITLYMLSEGEYMMCVNAGNREKILNWLSDYIEVEDVSDRTLQIALQGREAKEILGRFYRIEGIKYYHFKPFGDTIISRTGYTGEDGYEIYIDVEEGRSLFEELVKLSELCGLGARDVLRIEAGFPLYGNELSEDITPFEASLDRFVCMEKEFIGKEALVNFKPERRLVKLLLRDKGVPRKGYHVLKDNKKVGEVSSGTFSPTLSSPIALAFVDRELAIEGEVLNVDVRGKRLRAEVVGKFLP